MKKSILLLLYYMVFLGTACSQSLNSLPYDVKVDSSTFKIGAIPYNMATYTFTNTSNDDILFWFEEESCIGWNDHRKIKSYFFKNKGDVNLFLLIVEKNMTGNTGIVYETFLKKISTKEAFTVSFVSQNIDLDVFLRNCEKFVESHVVVVTADKVNEHASLNKYDTDEIYYNGDYISLPYQLVSE